MTIRILLADDHQIVREGIAALLSSQSDMQVVAQTGDGRQALQQARKQQPDIVIMDISMPGLNGIEATCQIKAELPATKVIALSILSEKSFVQGMLRAGVRGYLLKDCAFEELVNAVRTVHMGRFYLSPDISGLVVEGFLQADPGVRSEAAERLSIREREVLQLIAEGKSTREIAAILHVSAKTVETHRKHIMDKLNLKSIAELVKYAVREGLTTLNF